MKAEHGVTARRMAIEVLMHMETDGQFVNAALSQAFARKEIAVRDRAFVTALVMGVTRERLRIDKVIDKYSSRKTEKMPKLLLNVLRMGIFQLEEMTDIPPSAVLDTCCKLASVLGHKGLVSFTNGLLRNYLRQKDKETPASEISETETDASSLSAKFAVPEWMIQNWLTNYGTLDTIALLEYARRRPPLVLRVCGMSITTDGLQDILAAKQISTTVGALVASCLIVKTGKSFHGTPQSLPGFAEGLFSVQDESSAFAGVVVDPKQGELIIDLCAAPGGKSLHIAELMENTGSIIAVDKSEKRLEPLKQNRQILGLTNIQIKVADGATFTADRLADKVLIDAPCMGTGVLNRRPDQRFQKKPENLQSLVEMQRKLLAHGSSLVRPGGALVYSTCSIEPEENKQNIEWFLTDNNNFKAEDISHYLPESALQHWSAKAEQMGLVGSEANAALIDQAKQGMIQLLPSRHDVSGFFIAKMRRLG